MLTVFEDPDRIFRSLEAGATGYLLKKTPPGKLLEAIRDVHQGGSPMSNQIARRVIQAFQKPAPQANRAAVLTGREQEILQHLAQGLLYKEIAHALTFVSRSRACSWPLTGGWHARRR
jgi:DNA-binding NarL/FixJ family response regulator